MQVGGVYSERAETCGLVESRLFGHFDMARDYLDVYSTHNAFVEVKQAGPLKVHVGLPISTVSQLLAFFHDQYDIELTMICAEGGRLIYADHMDQEATARILPRPNPFTVLIVDNDAGEETPRVRLWP